MSPLIKIIGGKWTTEIMRELAVQPVRTRKFLVHIPGLTMKSLRERLQEMQEQNLIIRTEYGGRPLKVEYSLTERGMKILAILEALKQLAEEGLESTCCCSVEKDCMNGSKSLNCPFRRADTRKQRNS